MGKLSSSFSICCWLFVPFFFALQLLLTICLFNVRLRLNVFDRFVNFCVLFCLFDLCCVFFMNLNFLSNLYLNVIFWFCELLWFDLTFILPYVLDLERGFFFNKLNFLCYEIVGLLRNIFWGYEKHVFFILGRNKSFVELALVRVIALFWRYFVWYFCNYK